MIDEIAFQTNLLALNAIVEAAHEQSSGLQQINTAVNQMDQDTQKNAAMVEEPTAASHGLAREVASMNALLSQFKVPSSPPINRPHSVRSAEAPVAPSARALCRKIANSFCGKDLAMAAANTSRQEF